MRALLSILSVGLLSLGAAAALGAEPYRVPLHESGIGPDMVLIEEDGGLFLEVVPRRGEGYAALARRVTGDASHWRTIHRANGGSTTIYTTRRYRVPLHLLPEGPRARALERLWPRDRAEEEAWVHTVTSQRRFGRSDSLWLIAQLFTGDGSNWKAIRAHNGLRGTRLQPGDEIRIPRHLLRPALVLSTAGNTEPSDLEPAGEAKADEPYRIPSSYVNGELEYGQDDRGPYATYRLGAGEALYSAVVIRFTGRIDADEVNDTAREIARRSGIRDVKDIPVGYPVKIDLDLLTPEFLPPDHPRRIAYEESMEVGRDFARALHRTNDLRGVTVVLDAGHGGLDVGASNHVVWEDDYVYDIMCRVKALLELHTEAKVVVTIRDPNQGFTPHPGRFVTTDRDEVILTDPPFHHTSASLRAVNVHLRWYISNYHYHQAVRGGASPDRVVFTSFHADSLHPSVRGTMVYVPGHEYRRSRYGKSGDPYMRFKEVRHSPTVSFTSRELVKAEGLSRALADHLVAELESQKLGVHSFKPVRSHVIRNRREWVPAVLRYNKAPTSLLVEVVNLNNREDARLIQDADFRQRFAETYVRALVSHFEGR